jgi:hypothetical protein
MAADRDSPSLSEQLARASEQVARLYEEAEGQAAQAGEHLVGTQGFASLLGQLAENAAALTKLGNDAMDLVLRNLRLVGRRDVARLARQLGRTEDKLERVLQELEDLRDQLDERDEQAPPSRPAASARSRSHNGAGAGSPLGSRGGRSSRAGKGGGTESEESRGSS